MGANVSQVVETTVTDFVNQKETIQQNVPLGFAAEINASNIIITTSKLNILFLFIQVLTKFDHLIVIT